MNWSDDERVFRYSLVALFLIAPPTFISLRFLQAPYGKHYRKGWGPTIPPSLAWFLMESPTLWLTLLLFPFGRHSSNPKSLILISPFLFHYIHRTLIYPLRLHLTTTTTTTPSSSSNSFPVSIALTAFQFNLLNAYLQTRWVSNYADYESDQWWFWPRFAVGLVVFGWGMAVNVKSDLKLVALKREGGGYKIPSGEWFELVSCPNYFGEIVEWFGWTVMTWSWVGLAFCLYTCANLVPRGRANDVWYRHKFKDEYPKERKAVIPYVY